IYACVFSAWFAVSFDDSSSNFLVLRYCDHRDLHSFPTRRSSDLPEPTDTHAAHDDDTRSDRRRLGADRSRRPRTRIEVVGRPLPDRKSTRLNSSHVKISYAVFCLKKKKLKAYHVKQRERAMSTQ